ncbi:MAG TPA: sporulation protein [Firmicutes bacterium]|jgi:uncharacterized spore protein YtfJ|nr:sporulation protein [Bacillota bacterium]
MPDLNQFTDQLENLISSKTVIGDPITVGEVTLLPIIKANFGFGMGSGNTDGVKRGGGSGGGGGAVITPIAIVVVCGKEVDMLVIDKQESKGLAPLLERLPAIIEKMPFMKKKKEDDNLVVEEETLE